LGVRPKPTEDDFKVSDKLVQLVLVVYGVVIVESLVEYRDVVVEPIFKNHYVATAALAFVYLTTIFSWAAWQVSMSRYPYLLKRGPEDLRFGVDVVIGVMYAYMLFALTDVRSDPSGSLQKYLLGPPIIFALYLLSGAIRAMAYGWDSTKPVYSGLACFAFGVIALVYWLVFVGSHSVSGAVNLGTLASCLVVLLVYRYFRSRAA
jgi:hypothetical protein